jgi:hypothetical protein
VFGDDRKEVVTGLYEKERIGVEELQGENEELLMKEKLGDK